jgi:2TM domain
LILHFKPATRSFVANGCADGGHCVTVQTPDQHQEPEFMNTSSATPLSPEQIERMAVRRVKAKMGWFFHAAIYVCVNVFLVAASLFQGRHWHWAPLLGWGLGLAIHGAAVWFKASSAGDDLRERMLTKEREALSKGRSQ